MRQNIHDQAVMVPALTCEIIGLMRPYWLLDYRWRNAVQLKLMLAPWLLTQNLNQQKLFANLTCSRVTVSLQ
jgi:hypothetical protein